MSSLRARDPSPYYKVHVRRRSCPRAQTRPQSLVPFPNSTLLRSSLPFAPSLASGVIAGFNSESIAGPTPAGSTDAASGLSDRTQLFSTSSDVSPKASPRYHRLPKLSQFCLDFPRFYLSLSSHLLCGDPQEPMERGLWKMPPKRLQLGDSTGLHAGVGSAQVWHI
jgi:hypothetical protein